MELEQGVLAKERSDSVQGHILRTWLDQTVLPSFDGRVIAFDDTIALCCAFLHVPNSKSYRDSMIGASALIRGMTLVTQNTGDFIHMVDANGSEIKLLNPWN